MEGAKDKIFPQGFTSSSKDALVNMFWLQPTCAEKFPGLRSSDENVIMLSNKIPIMEFTLPRTSSALLQDPN
jgi:hypothetical protein